MRQDQNPRLLLLQARNPDDPMAAHEHQCFASALGVATEQMRCHDLLQGPPTPADLDETDLLLVGGAGEYSINSSHPFLPKFLDFLERVVVGDGFPTFASCFGFQGLIAAGGGKVVKDKPRSEVGTYQITLTETGAADPLFGPIGPTFKAQLGHVDRADGLPAGMVHLAYSERCPYQAIRIEGSRTVATQFHPELDREANALRYMRYLENYRTGEPVAPEEDPVLCGMQETPDATALLPRWVEAVTGVSLSSG